MNGNKEDADAHEWWVRSGSRPGSSPTLVAAPSPAGGPRRAIALRAPIAGAADHDNKPTLHPRTRTPRYTRLLLLNHDGKLVSGITTGYLLGGALLADLALRGRGDIAPAPVAVTCQSWRRCGLSWFDRRWKSGCVTDHDRMMRLAELTAALSLATDLGTGQPLEHGLRTYWLSLKTAEEMGLDALTRSCVYYTALLRFVGCASDASDAAVLAGGDDLAFNAAMAPMLMAQPGEGMRYFLRHLAEGMPDPRRIGRVAQALADPAGSSRSLTQHCEVGAPLAARLGLGGLVSHSLAHAYERWDGKGDPKGLAGAEVPVAVRIVTVARDLELWARLAGWAAAADVVARPAGPQL